jgi:hypothetical protein
MLDCTPYSVSSSIIAARDDSFHLPVICCLLKFHCISIWTLWISCTPPSWIIVLGRGFSYRIKVLFDCSSIVLSPYFDPSSLLKFWDVLFLPYQALTYISLFSICCYCVSFVWAFRVKSFYSVGLFRGLKLSSSIFQGYLACWSTQFTWSAEVLI